MMKKLLTLILPFVLATASFTTPALSDPKKLYIQNFCPLDLDAIFFLHAGGLRFDTFGWYKIKSSETISGPQVMSGGGRIAAHNNDLALEAYFENKDGSIVLAGANKQKFNGKTYGFGKIKYKTVGDKVVGEVRCQDYVKKKRQEKAAITAERQIFRQIYVDSYCSEASKIIASAAVANEKWKVQGPWNIPANAKNEPLTVSGAPFTSLGNHAVYIAGETVTKRNLRTTLPRTKTITKTFKKRSFELFKTKIFTRNGNTVAEISC